MATVSTLSPSSKPTQADQLPSTSRFEQEASDVDFLVLFGQLLKLLNLHCKVEKQLSQAQIDQVLNRMQSIADGYKSQGKWQIITSLASFVLKGASSLCPVLATSTFLPSYQGAERDQLFDTGSKILLYFGEYQTASGKIQETFSNSTISQDQTLKDIARLKADESSNSARETHQSRDGIRSAAETMIRQNWDVETSILSRGA